MNVLEHDFWWTCEPSSPGRPRALIWNPHRTCPCYYVYAVSVLTGLLHCRLKHPAIYLMLPLGCFTDLLTLPCLIWSAPHPEPTPVCFPPCPRLSQHHHCPHSASRSQPPVFSSFESLLLLGPHQPVDSKFKIPFQTHLLLPVSTASSGSDHLISLLDSCPAS